MGRPRLYHTPEEKAAANRAKWHKYYSKNRESICRRSRKKYEKTAKHPSSSANSTTITSLSQQIYSIEKKHTKIIGSNLHEYLSSIYSDYCSNGSNSTITKALSPIETLCDDAQHLQNDILMKDGLSLAWKEAEEVCKQLKRTRSTIEDLLCYALLGIDDVKEAHKQGELAYQNL